MRNHSLFALLSLSVCLLSACYESSSGDDDDGYSGGSNDGGDPIDSTGDAEDVARELVKIVRVLVPYDEDDDSWNNEVTEGNYGGQATVDGDLSVAGSDDLPQCSLDTVIEFEEYCHVADICFDGDIEYGGWIQHDRDDNEYIGGWAITGNPDVFGTYEDHVVSMEIMVVASDRAYGWIKIDGTEYEFGNL